MSISLQSISISSFTSQSNSNTLGHLATKTWHLFLSSHSSTSVNSHVLPFFVIPSGPFLLPSWSWSLSCMVFFVLNIRTFLWFLLFSVPSYSVLTEFSWKVQYCAASLCVFHFCLACLFYTSLHLKYLIFVAATTLTSWCLMSGIPVTPIDAQNAKWQVIITNRLL
jgi:hypothetical protein